MVKDSRYTVRKEFCGHLQPRWVVRFCGDWAGSYATYKEAREFVAADKRAA